MFKKSPLKATRLHKHKRRIRIAKGVFICIMLGLFVSGLAWLARIEPLMLTSVKVNGNIGIDSTDVSHIVTKHIAGTYGFIFPKANKLVYPRDAIAQEIKAAFPSINVLHIETEDQHVEVSIEERRPSYVWCKDSPENKNAGCYFMDATGYIFSEAPQYSGDAYFRFYGIVAAPDPIGETYLDASQVKVLDTFQELLRKDDISITAFIAKENGVREVRLTPSGKILFKSSQDPLELAASISLLKEKTKLFNKENQSTLEYVDLRFGNKVYYKRVGDNQVLSEE